MEAAVHFAFQMITDEEPGVLKMNFLSVGEDVSLSFLQHIVGDEQPSPYM